MQENLLALSPQTELNGYVIDSVLGQGGFGVVYKAWHKKLEEWVVIKEFLPSELAGRVGSTVQPHDNTRDGLFKDCLQRFVDEGKTLIRLKHNNIVRCRDLFEANGTEYLVMDYEEGVPLDELLKTRESKSSQYTQDQLLHILIPIADGLSYIHQEGVLHRDIKPANVFIRRKNEEAVLIDFGAAKQNFAEVSQSQAPFTEFYAPLEQMETTERAARPTIDIHAFGGMMYRMVVGRIGASAVKRAMAISSGQDDPLSSISNKLSTESVAMYSPEFLQLIDQCLAFKAADRPQTMQEVLDRLKAIQQQKLYEHRSQPVQMVSPNLSSMQKETVQKEVVQQEKSEPAQARGKKWAAVAVAFLLCLLAGGYWGYEQYQLSLEEQRMPQTEAKQQELAQQAYDEAVKLYYWDNKRNQQVIRLLEKASELGHPYAGMELAKQYYSGAIVTKAPLKARTLWENAKKALFQAVEKGDLHAQYLYGYMQANGQGYQQNESSGVAWYRKAAEQGYALAQSNLGYMYDIGNGVSQDNTQAVYWYRKAAEQGYATAQHNLGYMYEKGRGVSQDDVQAVYWYRKAAEQEYASAQCNLGVMYRDGEGVSQDDAQAVYWYRKAAEQGHATAQTNLGDMYKNGYGVSQDYSQAVYWYRKAAEQGYASAQNKLGVQYRNGKGVNQDDAQAVYWYRKAAEQGYASAQHNLGYMYDEGKGVNEDDAQAVYWYRKAAEQGHASAQTNLGYMYKYGYGVSQDYSQAVYWSRQGARQGEKTAQQNLRNWGESW